MKQIFAFLALTLFSTAVFAQATTAPGAPAAAPQGTATDQLQQMLGSSPKMQQNLNQAIVVGMLMNCTQQSAGKDATQAFYNKIKATGQTIQADCKAGKDDDAKALTLATIDQNHNDPVAVAAVACYGQQQQNIQSMGGPKVAADMAKYAGWARDPAAAHAQMTDADICKHKNQGVQ